jgi:hypothetical protein
MGLSKANFWLRAMRIFDSLAAEYLLKFEKEFKNILEC